MVVADPSPLTEVECIEIVIEAMNNPLEGVEEEQADKVDQTIAILIERDIIIVVIHFSIIMVVKCMAEIDIHNKVLCIPNKLIDQEVEMFITILKNSVVYNNSNSSNNIQVEMIDNMYQDISEINPNHPKAYHHHLIFNNNNNQI